MSRLYKLVFHPLILTFTGRGVAASGALLLTFVVAQKFPKADAGHFLAAFAVLTTAGFVCRFGLDVLSVKTLPALRKAGQEGNALKPYIAQATGTVLGLGLGVSLAAFVLHLFLDLKVSGLIWTCLVPFSLISLHGAFLRANNIFGPGAFTEAGLAAFLCAVLLYIMPLGFSPLGPLTESWLILSFCCWLIFGFSWFVLGKHRLFVRPAAYRFSPKLFGETKTYGVTQITSNLAQWGALFIIIMLVDAATASEANALFRFLAPLQFIFLTLDFYLGPKFSGELAAARHPNAVKSHRRVGILAATLLSAPFILAVVFASAPLINTVLGPQYLVIESPLLILVLAHLFVLALGSNGIFLSVSGNQKCVLVATFARAGASLVLYILLIPLFQLWAVCLIYSLGVCVEAVYFRVKADRVLARR